MQLRVRENKIPWRKTSCSFQYNSLNFVMGFVFSANILLIQLSSKSLLTNGITLQRSLWWPNICTMLCITGTKARGRGSFLERIHSFEGKGKKKQVWLFLWWDCYECMRWLGHKRALGRMFMLIYWKDDEQRAGTRRLEWRVTAVCRQGIGR